MTATLSGRGSSGILVSAMEAIAIEVGASRSVGPFQPLVDRNQCATPPPQENPITSFVELVMLLVALRAP